MHNKQRGWSVATTLIIIVLTIVVIAIFLPWIIQDENYRVTKAKADIVRISGALTEFYKEKGFYPNTTQGLHALVDPLTPVPSPNDSQSKLYLRNFPHDPWGRAYIYENPGIHNPNTYDLFTFGPSGKPGDIVIGNW